LVLRVKAIGVAWLCLLVCSPTVSACTRSVDANRAIGLPCSAAAQCVSLCLPPSIYPGGFCSRACRVDDECPVGALCSNNVCLFACFDDDDCSLLANDLRGGWSCRDLAGKLVCAPDGLQIPDAGAISDGP
jgi:hypothetical protein